ncbi:NusG domain II-containing protein [Eubacterium oxidoreducens]|uniref:Uncharacterized protein n=1 Tax=Eubacterium oxidoreducens TaxID=1732 RepID=A0A1G6ANF8_EUBOX|nr:NusG domain II-containing protein [Eubacterium oxidoreducens]SDB09713.1 hypothetical protein SAMN02910417_00742 [Eubacterium oxidoreducens]
MEEYYQPKFRKRDALLIGLVLAFAVCIFVIMHTIGAKSGNLVRISVDGEIYGEYSLEQDETIYVTSKDTVTNVVIIQDGYVSMEEADCPDQLCVEQGKIHLANESIICLPNKVVVEILENGDDDSASLDDGVDAIAK